MGKIIDEMQEEILNHRKILTLKDKINTVTENLNDLKELLND